MFKYLKYFTSTFILLIGGYTCSIGTHFPTYFFIGFSLVLIFGDMFLGEDTSNDEYKYPQIINFPMYINLPILFLFVLVVVSVFSNSSPIWVINILDKYIYIDFIEYKNSITILDKFSLVAITSLFMGIMGTVPGHELTHRKKDKFDMFIGNWMLALSWDCAFAIEHVYGHHKNVGLPIDPATAKRGDNIYMFILNAAIKEHKDAWILEFEHLKRRGIKPFGLQNKMIIGYLRSLSITVLAYLIGGLMGMIFYLLLALITKALLEAINYTEHYGLVREPGKPVCPRHSWNSNHILSGLILYNITRHSSHHEKSNIKFWKLKAYPDAPMMPLGYLGMLYLAIFLPYFYNKIMARKLIDWDENYATERERKIALIDNKNSGISLLMESSK